MKIGKTGVYGVGPSLPDTGTPGTRKASGGVPEDNAKVSGEARSLFEADQAKKVEEIQSRIDSGYYFSSEVTSKLVRVLRSLLTRK